MAARAFSGLLAAAAIALSGAARAQAGADALVGADPNASPRELVARALAYEHGEGVTKDYTKAAFFYCEAARRGDAEGQYALGWMYANGRGLPHDDAIAASLFAVVLRSAGAAEKTGLFVLQDGRARFTPVEAGLIGGLEMSVKGVSEGTPVVAGPFQALREMKDGDRVTAK